MEHTLQIPVIFFLVLALYSVICFCVVGFCASIAATISGYGLSLSFSVNETSSASPKAADGMTAAAIIRHRTTAKPDKNRFFIIVFPSVNNMFCFVYAAELRVFAVCNSSTFLLIIIIVT